MADVFHGLPQSVRENDVVILKNYAMIVLSHIFSDPLFTNRPIVRRSVH
jgi:hypothetical protein